MTIPSRPAPAPPVAHGQSAAAGANASIEQLRLQLQQQQLQQQQSGGMQKMTFNIPPPPKRPISAMNTNASIISNNNNFASFSMEGNQSTITRKFPQARYTPATNWDDDPFSLGGNISATNGNFKKIPPPRPPPPKVQVNGRKAPQPPNHPTKLLNNIFRLKKSNSNTNNKAKKVYGVSIGAYSSSTNTSSSNKLISTTNYTSNSSSANALGAAACATSNLANGSSWQVNSNSSYTSTSLNSWGGGGGGAGGASSSVVEAQLISFDSPPSSPTFTQKSNSDCLSVDSFSSDSNFSSPNNGSVSQPESGFEDDFTARSRPATTSPLDPWEAFDSGFNSGATIVEAIYGSTATTAGNIGTAPVRNLGTINTRIQSSNDNPLCNGKSLLPPTPTVSVPTIIKPKVSTQKLRAPKPPILPKPQFDHNSVNDAPPSPPMPLCAPPPPPLSSTNCVSLLDVISGKADALQLSGAVGSGGPSSGVAETRPFGVALYDFDGIEEGDLCFRENEKIYILDQVSAEWYRGRTRSGCEGIFPINYIDIKVPLKEEKTAAPLTLGINNVQQTAKSKPLRVRCLYNFPAEYETDLALKENDMVTILYRINEDWLFGEIDNRQGQFPANFLEY
ncbi:putative mediator of RNA polymerase II transcription subunit 26 [Eurosta solidaginis]|uniref:putative mediator of RNA polymerase II transcription subunit 26 n=1 Tax=Eurosta solidaginis TaxID=178769 RepID=UPI00353098C9